MAAPIPVARLSDVFILGNHRLLCGDARDLNALLIVLGGLVATMVFTDHPYNLAANSISGAGKIKHDDFVMASGEMSRDEFGTFLTDSIKPMMEVSKDGAVFYFCMDWRSIELLLKVGRELGLPLLNICVWIKNNGGMGSMMRSKYENIAMFKNGQAPFVNNVQLGRYGRYRTNVLQYSIDR